MTLTNRSCGCGASGAGSCVPRRGAGLLLAAAVLLLSAHPAWAVPAFGLQMKVIIDASKPESDANLMNVKVWGDEHCRVMEDLNGYALIRDGGYLCYAQLSLLGTDLVSTKKKVGSVNPSMIKLVARNVHLNLSKLFAAVPALSLAREAQLRSPPSTTTTGQRRALCILIQFPEKNGSVTVGQVTSFCNGNGSAQPKYSEFGNNGSVYDFFLDVSNGQLQFTHVVYGYWTAQHARSFYDDKSKQSSGAQALIMEALKGLQSQIDFSQIDVVTGSDGKPTIQFLSVLYAGNMPADNGYPLWPHRWAIGSASPAVDQTVTGSDGKTYYADLYQISDIGDSLAIGTFCHECGHLVCGYSDYYDTSFNSSGLGNWCLMAGGNWLGGNSNNSATDPAPPHPYLRYKAGWLTPKAADSSISSLACNMSDVIKYANPGNTSEYYLISAIQKTAHQAHMPGEGLAIFHVDESKAGNNEPDHTPGKHYESALIQADNQYHLEQNENSGGNRGDSNDLFFASNVAAFTDTSSTTNNANWWNGTASGLSVTQIGSSGGSSISFQLGSSQSSSNPKITSGPSANPNPASVGQNINFSVSASDPNNQALTYAWDFGDNSTGSGDTVAHSYTANGNYSATVKVTNASGDAVSSTLTVNIGAPQITSGPSASPNPANTNQNITFSVSASDLSNQTLTYAWDFGDGSTGSDASVVHSYTVTGAYTVTIKVTNLTGAMDSSTLAVNVEVKPATINKAKFQLNFKTGKDSLDEVFTSPDFIFANQKALLAATNGHTVSILIGSTQVDSMTLSKGRGKGSGTLTWGYKKGEIHYTIRNTALENLLNSYGAANDNVPAGSTVSVPLVIAIDGLAYGGPYTFAYSASKNKVGKGSVSKPQQPH